jgi:hypothetical protein
MSLGSRRGGRAIPGIGAGLDVSALRYKISLWRNRSIQLSEQRHDGSGEGERDGFLAFIAQASLAHEGTSAEHGPLADRILVAGAVAQ